jgi:membrane associated rhomboid family serine protease
MRSRSPYGSQVSNFSASFGPGPITPAVKYLIAINVAVYLVMMVQPELTFTLGVRPQAVIEGLRLWQVVTYMFAHGDLMHLLFNMLTLWMVGVELERRWGTRFFTQYYFVTGVGAAVTQVVLGLLPYGIGNHFYNVVVIGASGAIYGLLLAYALYYPYRQFLMFFVFPVQARYFVMILGAISLLLGMGGSGSGVAHFAHLAGLVIGYLYLRGGRGKLHLFSEIQYRLLKWRINRSRRKFDVYSGGRANDVDRRIH